MSKSYRTTRRFKTQKKTTTKAGKREYMKNWMREKRAREVTRAVRQIRLVNPAQNILGFSIATEVTGFRNPRSSIIAKIHGLPNFNNRKTPKRKRKK